MMTNMNGLSLDFIIHPGETVKEFLEKFNMSQEELATRTGFTAKHISEIVNGKKGISAKMAKALEYAFGTPMSFWVNLQGIYDKEILQYMEQEEIEEEELKIVRKLKKIMKYAEEKGLIENDRDEIFNLMQLRKLCGINNLSNIKYLLAYQTSFRASDSIDIESTYVWIRINELLAKKNEIKNIYNKELLKEKIQDIKETMFLDINDAIEKLTQIFAECGIIFQLSKSFTGAPVQGFIKKINEQVLLTMTIRGAFADIFWFSLFHEIGHLINEDFNTQFIDYISNSSDKEIKADTFASNTLIDKSQFIEFLNRQEFTKEEVMKLAKRNNVKDFIIVGRLERELNDYRILSDMRLKYIWK